MDFKVRNIIHTPHKIAFTPDKSKSSLSQALINRFDLNIETLVGYKEEKSFEPAPQSLDVKLAKFFNTLQVDWKTHVSKNPSKKQLF